MDKSNTLKKPKVLFFDINETILNTDILRSILFKHFGEDVYDLWFSKLLHYSLVSTVTNSYRSFKLIAGEAFVSICHLKQVEPSTAIFNELTNSLSMLPAHLDVEHSLKILKEKGYLIIALSNSSESLLNKQLSFAKISHLFDQQISVEIVQKYKPHVDVYQKAAKLLETPIEECLLVATHDWDIYGALCAGLQGAFIKRKQNNSYNLPLNPTYSETDLALLAQRL